MTATEGLRHDGIVESASWFGPDDRPLFGWFVYPESLRIRGAVVLCQPLAEEGNMAYRTFRRLSQRLASVGFLALRFDYDGTGDSAGSFEDPGRREAWLASVRHAVAAVRAWNAESVSIVGMRLGATLAYRAAADGDLDLDELVLWDPCAAGRTFLREWQLVHAPWLEGRQRAPEGWVETPSYRFTPDAAAEVRGLAMTDPPEVATLARRTIVLTRPDRKVSPVLREALPTEQAAWMDAVDQDLLLDVPTLVAAVPSTTLQAVVDDLDSALPRTEVALQPRQRTCATWTEGGIRISEEAGWYGSRRDLFGMSTTAASGDGILPRVLTIGVAAERHLGEGRSWVRIGRQAAGTGFVSIRLDHSGVGDSATRPGHDDDEIYNEDWLGDIPDVARGLSEKARPDVIAVGLCSSGSSALEALGAGAVREAIVTNVVFTVDADTRLPAAWATFRRMPRWLTDLQVKHRRAATGLWRASSAVDPRRAGLWHVRNSIRAGGEATLLVGDDDVSQVTMNRFWTGTWGRVLRRSGRFRMVHVPDADHSLRVSAGQDEVVQAVVRRLDAIAADGPR
ncbi:hypothetical protein [Humibacter ginsengisoli]